MLYVNKKRDTTQQISNLVAALLLFFMRLRAVIKIGGGVIDGLIGLFFRGKTAIDIPGNPVQALGGTFIICIDDKNRIVLSF